MGLVAAVGTAITAVAGSIGVTVTATALTVGFETIAAVGAGLSAIGAVTHDKALSYVGAGLGLVGGIGALASSAGVLGTDASGVLGGTGGSDAVLGGNGAVDSGTFDAGTAADAATGSTSSDVVDSLSGTADSSMSLSPNDVSGASINATSPQAASASTAPMFNPSSDQQPFVGLESTSNGTQAAAPTTTGQAAPAAPTTAPAPATMLQNPAGTLDPAAGMTQAQVQDAFSYGQGLNAPGSQSGSAFDSIVQLLDKHPLLATGVVTAGGSLLSGVGNELSGVTPAQVNQLNAQAASNQATANLTAQQTKNLAQSRSSAALAPVTGTPNTIITPPSAGIINGAPPVNVTGTPT